MRILLISANTEAINMIAIPVGLGAVAASAMKAGHDVRMLDLIIGGEPGAAISNAVSEFGPGVIGISVRNIDDQSSKDTKFLLERVREVISACRDNSEAQIVLGGAGYSIFPESALAYLGADMGIQGEGEAAFVELVGRMEKGEDVSLTPGLYLPGKAPAVERKFVENLDSLPIPPASMWSQYDNSSRDIWLPFQTRRGCPMDCSYCSTALIEGEAIRKRNTGAVADALTEYSAAGFKRIYFTDNTFNMPYSYAMDLCRRLIDKKADIKWRCILYPKHIDDDLAKAMAGAGCREASLGFESGCDGMLKSLNKKFDADEVREIAGILAAHGIKRMGFLLLGGPGETKDTVIASLEFADSLKMDAMRITGGIRIYPHTELAVRAVEDGIISPEDDLLFPKFYIAPGLEGWLRETIDEWALRRPNWIT